MIDSLKQIVDALHLLAYVTNPSLYHKALSKEYSTGVTYREWLEALESKTKKRKQVPQIPDDEEY